MEVGHDRPEIRREGGDSQHGGELEDPVDTFLRTELIAQFGFLQFAASQL
jgi:hypothetical protein